MAKGTAECTCKYCGNKFTVSKTCSNRSDADNWEAWAEAHYDECPDCYKARMQREREEANRKAVADSVIAGLPELSGSEKQISWATKIRKDFIDERFPLDKLSDTGKDCLMDFMSSHKESRYWIDNRFSFGEIQNSIVDLWNNKYSDNTK